MLVSTIVWEVVQIDGGLANFSRGFVDIAESFVGLPSRFGHIDRRFVTLPK
jgi:hypothetical protein